MKQSLLGIVALLAVCGALVFGLSYFFGGDSDIDPVPLTNLTDTEEVAIDEPLDVAERADYEPAANQNRMNPIAVMTTNYGVIEIELFDDAMPITAGNFMNLARDDFYNGTKFHRVIDGFMIQGGDPNTKTDETLTYGRGGPGYTIPDEHIAGDKLTNVRGTISMANSGPESGGSQFFINLVDNTNLDFDKQPLTSKHPVFGQVVSGMDVVDAIGQVATGPTNLPLEDVVIESVEIREG